MKPPKRWIPPPDDVMAKIFPKWKQRPVQSPGTPAASRAHGSDVVERLPQE